MKKIFLLHRLRTPDAVMRVGRIAWLPVFVNLFLLLITSSISAQETNSTTIKGKVIDEKGAALSGVSVHVKGTSTGTTTNTDGDFSIQMASGHGTLVFSYIGYASKELYIREAAAITVTLELVESSLQNVVVVGYGTQKKVNLTGAVDQVGKEVLENRPMTNITRGLQGVIPNLNIRMTDGKPIRGATYNVRGATSIGAGGSALVLIDGVPADPNLLNPDDV